jgi:hypothetical protein
MVSGVCPILQKIENSVFRELFGNYEKTAKNYTRTKGRRIRVYSRKMNTVLQRLGHLFFTMSGPFLRFYDLITPMHIGGEQ